MDIQEKCEAFEANFKTTEIYSRECAIRKKDILEFSPTMRGYFNIIANNAWQLWQAAKAQAVPEGFVLVPKEPTGAMVKAGSWNDYAHSLPDNHVVEIYKLMIQAAQEPSVVEIKINWGCSCTKCGASEAIIASTASGVLKHGWFHDGDEVKCVECGNTGEMDARGEDSDICWNENEAQEPSHD